MGNSYRKEMKTNWSWIHWETLHFAFICSCSEPTKQGTENGTTVSSDRLGGLKGPDHITTSSHKPFSTLSKANVRRRERSQITATATVRFSQKSGCALQATANKGCWGRRRSIQNECRIGMMGYKWMQVEPAQVSRRQQLHHSGPARPAFRIVTRTWQVAVQFRAQFLRRHWEIQMPLVSSQNLLPSMFASPHHGAVT